MPVCGLDVPLALISPLAFMGQGCSEVTLSAVSGGLPGFLQVQLKTFLGEKGGEPHTIEEIHNC